MKWKFHHKILKAERERDRIKGLLIYKLKYANVYKIIMIKLIVEFVSNRMVKDIRIK